MKIEIAFGKVLKRYRKEKGLSQEFLALKAGFDRTYISLLERGLRNPSLGNVFILAAILEIEVEVFIKEVSDELNSAPGSVNISMDNQ